MKSIKLLTAVSLLCATAALVFYTQPRGPRTVAITASRNGFDAAQITLKQGEPAKLVLTSQDVRHGLVIRQLGVAADIVPGKTTEVMITPQSKGKFTGFCDYFCGPTHKQMRISVVVE